MVVARRPPKIMALIGTPFGSLTSGAQAGLLVMGAAKRLLACAAGSLLPGVHGRPFQSVRFAGGSLVLPSHQTSKSGVRATLVYMVSREMVAIAFGLVWPLVPGATPK